MKILFAVWELDPFFKFGGLGDVARSLPGALKKIDIDIRVILPYYKALKLGKIKRERIASAMVEFASKSEKIEIFSVIHPSSGVLVYLIRNRKYLDIASSYETFAFFNKAVVSILKKNILSWNPEIIHCNDHHTGFIPLLVREANLPYKTLITLHNLAYQGKSPLDVLQKVGIEKTRCRVVRWEIKSKKINFLLEGIIHADVITTVSPSYAKEIMTEEFGMGLEEVLRSRQGRVFGILNGIDIDWRTHLYTEAVRKLYKKRGGKSISFLPKISSWKEEKALNKRLLQKKLRLRVDNTVPLISFIGRFTPRQKGLDILHKMIRRLEGEEHQFVILGKGDEKWEERFHWLSTFYPKNVSCTFEFDENLAHQIYAGSDLILVPSKFEPCGLIQMIAMRYGTLPIAHRTGGLKDSIKNGINGFLFDKYTSYALESELIKATYIWRRRRKKYEEMVKAAMRTDFSWVKSAKEYLNLYRKLVDSKL